MAVEGLHGMLSSSFHMVPSRATEVNGTQNNWILYDVLNSISDGNVLFCVLSVNKPADSNRSGQLYPVRLYGQGVR